MSQWKRTWKKNKNDMQQEDEAVKMKNKMRKLRKKRENPQNIVEFENIYERPQSSNSIIEGMEDKDRPLEDIKDRVNDMTDRWSDGLDPSKIKDPISGLENQFEDILGSMDNLQDFGSTFESVGKDFVDAGKGVASGASTLKNVFDFDQKSIQGSINKASDSVESVTSIIKNIIGIFGQKLAAFRVYAQILMLKANRYVKKTITRMANALTQNTATQEEIDIFQDQTQKFITLLLVWYFVYNWYYIIFFLEDDDNIRYEFDVNYLKKISKYLYGFFGPGLKPIEKFNQGVLYCGNLKNYLNTSVIMILMFIVFYTLVQNNFQTSLLKDFFSAMNGKSTSSLLSLFTMCVVLWYSFSWFFGDMSKGNFEAGKLFVDAYPGGVWSIAFACVMFVLAFLGYFLWIMSVNIPMGVVMITGYLVLYTFFGVLFYEGFNFVNIFTGISDSVTPISPDLTAEACKPDPEFLTFDWFQYKIQQLVEFIKNLMSFASVSMFEILIILLLLGGIGVYRKNWTSATSSKVGMGPYTANNLSGVFKNLFAWLILINLMIIIIMVIFLVKKYKLLTDLNVGDGSDLAAKDQTMRSRMASNNSSFKSSDPAVSMRAKNRIQAQKKIFNNANEDSGNENIPETQKNDAINEDKTDIPSQESEESEESKESEEKTETPSQESEESEESEKSEEKNEIPLEENKENEEREEKTETPLGENETNEK